MQQPIITLLMRFSEPRGRKTLNNDNKGQNEKIAGFIKKYQICDIKKLKTIPWPTNFRNLLSNCLGGFLAPG